MNGFSNQPLRLQKKPINSFYTPIPGVTGRVASIDRKNWTCEVETIAGDVKGNVRIPGPALTREGDAYGRFSDIKKDQLVFVGYNMGVQNSPIILEKYPYYATDNDLSNLKAFMSKYPEIIEGEFVDFHDSGYCVRYQQDTIIWQDKTKAPVLTINMTSGLVLVNQSFQAQSLTALNSLTVGNGLYKAIKTPSLLQWMGEMYATLSALKSAIDSVVPVPSDGGAAIKTALSGAFNSFPPADVPVDISNTNSGFGDP